MKTLSESFVRPVPARTWLVGTGAILCLWSTTPAAQAQVRSSNQPQVRRVVPVEAGQAPVDVKEPQAVVLTVKGKCEYSSDGTSFTPLPAGRIFTEGAVVRTGKDAMVDIFFRRIGTTVRLQADTEIKLEKMDRQMKDGEPVMTTLLDLKAGRIFTVVRSLVAGSTMEIRNAAGRSVVEGGGGKGRYIITANGTQVTEKNSIVPLKLLANTGITVIAPGMKYEAKEGKMFAVETPEAVQFLIDFDELEALGDRVPPAEVPATGK